MYTMMSIDWDFFNLLHAFSNIITNIRDVISNNIHASWLTHRDLKIWKNDILEKCISKYADHSQREMVLL